ncbi:hypothetical protein J6590_006753 [Homalodisca vitripennis]|nr:hypothetical protein J6590_006753 [Homalodisca vitripennis]
MLNDCLSNSKFPKRCNSAEECKYSCVLKTQNAEPQQVSTVSDLILVNSAVGKWYRATTKNEIFDILKSIGGETYRFVAGNTAQGVYKDETTYQNLIDISCVPELKTFDVSSEQLTIGVNLSLSELILLLRSCSSSSQFHYTAALADHIALVANLPVRNVGTLAGNLCIKKLHPDFPSDLFVILETVGAKLLLESETGNIQSTSMTEFLSMDINKVLLTHVVLPALDNTTYVFNTFKIMPRTKNAYAYVNAGFLFKVDKEAKFRVLEKPSIVFGGISPTFVHASETEKLIESLGNEGKGLLEENVLKFALESLEKEIKPVPMPPVADPKYRAGLAVALFYKCMLSLSPVG